MDLEMKSWRVIIQIYSQDTDCQALSHSVVNNVVH